jgi:uncharacterized protein (TIGR02145 family)
VIDWYADDVTTSTLHTGESYTPEIATSTTYYAQARVENTGCLSARMAVTAEVDMDGCCTAPGATVDFTAFYPCNVTAGNTWTLRDTRAGGNNNTYIVKKMADERIWMVQDLWFGNCEDNPWRNDECSSCPVAQPTVYADASSTYAGHCKFITVSGRKIYLYNWSATMNNKNAYAGAGATTYQCTGTGAGTVSPNPSYCKGICPDGWHIPTGGEFQALYAKLGNASNATTGTNFTTSPTKVDNNPQHWHGSGGGGCIGDGTLGGQGASIYWSSTPSKANYSYILYADGSNVIPNYNDYNGWQWGWVVRCVRNY